MDNYNNLLAKINEVTSVAPVNFNEEDEWIKSKLFILRRGNTIIFGCQHSVCVECREYKEHFRIQITREYGKCFNTFEELLDIVGEDFMDQDFNVVIMQFRCETIYPNVTTVVR